MTATEHVHDETEKPGLGTRIGEFSSDLISRLFRSGGPKRPWWKLRVSTIIALSILMLGIAGRVNNVPWVEWVRLKTFDLYQQIEPREIQTLANGRNMLPVGIVDLDEKACTRSDNGLGRGRLSLTFYMDWQTEAQQGLPSI